MNAPTQAGIAGTNETVASSGWKSLWDGVSDWVEGRIGVPGDSEEKRRRKLLFTITSILVVPAGVIWGSLYYAFGEHTVALIPLAYSVITLLDFLCLLQFGMYETCRQIQQVLILLLPFALQIALGGFVGGSTVILWSFIAVLSAVLFGSIREASWWFAAFVSAILVAALVQPSLEIENRLPHEIVFLFFILNLVTVPTIVFVVLYSFVTDRRKLRELEVAYLNQEMMLRQSEKLATLGTLAAGVAHELNNPAAATHRAAEQLRDAFARLEAAHVRLNRISFDESAQRQVQELEHRIRDHATRPANLDALARSDHEAVVEEWLAANGIEDPWDLAPPLVAQGLDPAALADLRAIFDAEEFPVLLQWASSAFPVYALLNEIGHGSSRLSEIVGALRGYTYLGQAPVQPVNIHEGIDNTLVILANKLRKGVTVRREYGPDVPPVMASGNELNQVWTNLLVNAVDALNGGGRITIRTFRDGEHVVIHIDDDGSGIPAEIQSRIFDPFFTTKPPGKGTGLGLSTTHTIVTEKHKGTISVESRPGFTRFTVKLPVGNQSENVTAKGE